MPHAIDVVPVAATTTPAAPAGNTGSTSTGSAPTGVHSHTTTHRETTVTEVQDGPDVMAALKTLAKAVPGAFKRTMKILAAIALVWVSYEYFIADNHLQQWLPQRDSKKIVMQDMLEGLHDGLLEAQREVRTRTKTDPDQVIADTNTQLVIAKDREAKVGHPELTGCQATPGPDEGASSIWVVSPNCTAPFNAGIHIDKNEQVAEVRILTKDGLLLEINPQLATDPNIYGEVHPLGDYRFRMKGLVWFHQNFDIAGGYKIRVTPVN